jgi:predicted RNA binding protein YcfA (HicA-like mRNA interferase family)
VKVRDVIRALERDGRRLHSTVGSHRQFKHPSKPGRVTVAGQRNDDLALRTLHSIHRQAGWKR